MECGSRYAYIGDDEEVDMILDHDSIQVDLDSENEDDHSTTTTTTSSTTRNTDSKRKKKTVIPTSINNNNNNNNNINQVKTRVKKSNTNVLLTKLGTLSDESSMATGDPIFCKSCKAVLSNINNFKEIKLSNGVSQENVPTGGGVEKDKWICEFCNTENEVQLVPEEIPSSNVIDYILEPAPITSEQLNNEKKKKEEEEEDLKKKPSVNNNTYLIFCIDLSGSMSTTYFVTDQSKHIYNKPTSTGHVSNYVSRLQFIQTGIEKQLVALKQSNPHQKVGIITFNREVTIIGDGSEKPVVIPCGDKLDSVPHLLEVGSNFSITKTIEQSFDSLVPKIRAMDHNGLTALGPAITVAIGICSNLPGSRIVLATDGIANVGCGCLEDPATNRVREDQLEFYNQMGDLAQKKGTSISVFSIKGQDSKLEQLGKLTEKTNGEINIADPSDIEKNFKAAIELTTLATNVSIKLKLHHQLYVNEPSVGKDDSLIEKQVGNVNQDTTVAFEYGLKPNQKIDKSLKSLPFQLQIYYTTLSGSKCMRVITQTLRTTADKDLAEDHADIDVLGVNLAQQSSKIASVGDYQNSRAKNIQSANVLNRAIKKKEIQIQKQIQQQQLQPQHNISPQLQQQQYQMLQQQQQQIQSGKAWVGQSQTLENHLTKLSSAQPQKSSSSSNLSSSFGQPQQQSDETSNLFYNMKTMNTQRFLRK
eukprot:gene3644-4538_t